MTHHRHDDDEIHDCPPQAREYTQIHTSEDAGGGEGFGLGPCTEGMAEGALLNIHLQVMRRRRERGGCERGRGKRGGG
jgi:hypothetical protein